MPANPPGWQTRLLPFDDRVDPALVALAESYVLYLHALNRSPHTVAKYWQTLRALGAFLALHGMPQRVDAIRREHLEAFLTAQLAQHSASTAKGRFGDLRSFFEWLVADEELHEYPMRRMKAPKVPEASPAVLREDAMRRLLATCNERTFSNLRDAAILSVLYDTGMRRAELAGLRLGDVDLALQTVVIERGKGGYSRVASIGRKAARAIDRYRRVRATHPHAQDAGDALWLGRQGPLAPVSILHMVKRRARAAGLDTRVWVHLFRHSFAHAYLSSGGQEGDLMVLGGWHSREIMGHYGRSAAADRARDAHRQHSPLDRL